MERDRARRLNAAVEFVRKIPQPYQPTLTGPSAVKQFFQRQEDAIRFAAPFGDDVFIFSFETPALGDSGARRFVVTSAECFLHEYKQLEEKFKHYYEVIPEGHPCRLYCDLEFYREGNPHLNGEEMTKIFVDVLLQSLDAVFNAVVPLNEVLVLDSSSAVKFSKHLIFTGDQAAFADNGHMGTFMRAVHRAVLSLQASGPVPACCSACRETTAGLVERLGSEARSYGHLLVKPKAASGPPTFFCDLGVYSRNRNFRLMGSSKLGKANPLRTDPAWPAAAPNLMGDDRRFLRSLVTNVAPTDSSTPLLTLPCRCRRDALAVSSVSAPVGDRCSVLEGADDCLTGHGASPYAEVDHFVQREVLQGRGRVRRWVYFTRRELLSYDVVGNRFCHNVGREHRSNNVIYVVDLRQKVFYQKCLDPDCRAANYRSPDWPLPPSILPWNFLEDEERPVEEMEDDWMLLRVLEEVEHGMEASATEDPSRPHVEREPSTGRGTSSASAAGGPEIADVR